MSYEIMRNKVVQFGAGVVGSAALVLTGNLPHLQVSGEAQAAAASFGGVEVEGIACPPANRGVNLKQTGTEAVRVLALHPVTGAEIGRAAMFGAPNRAFIAVSEANVGEDVAFPLRVEAFNSSQVLGTGSATMNCVEGQPPATNTSTTTTTSTTSQPGSSIPGGEQGTPVNGGTTSSTTTGPVNPPAAGSTPETKILPGSSQQPNTSGNTTDATTSPNTAKPAKAEAKEGRWLALTGMVLAGFR